MRSQAQEIGELKRMILHATTKESKALFGWIERLAKEHGSLAHALKTAVQVGHNARKGLVTLSGHFDTFCDGLEDCISRPHSRKTPWSNSWDGFEPMKPRDSRLWLLASLLLSKWYPLWVLQRQLHLL